MKTPSLQILLGAGALVGLCACSALKPASTSRRNPDYSGHLDRLLVVYHQGEEQEAILGRHFSVRFLQELQDGLRSRGVEVEWVSPTYDDWNQAATIRSVATRFAARQILHVGLTDVYFRSQPYTAAPGGFMERSHGTELTFSFTVNDLEADLGLWRGSVRYRTVPNPEGLALQLINLLNRDELLSPNPSAEPPELVPNRSPAGQDARPAG